MPMNCSCCCTNTLNFCTQDVCDEIDFDILAQKAGVHKLIAYFLDAQVTLTETFAIGDNISFPLDGLNENYEYTVELYDPEDVKVLIRKDDIDYDCFKFKTVLNVAV